MENEELSICFKYKATALHSHSKFFHKYGFTLNSNLCSNECCFIYNNGEQIPLPEVARYCDECGNETNYFKKGLLELFSD